MSKKIEILENTLLKLLVRRGTDVDRQLITLDQGELGFTTDSKRLFVGDGSTLGGLITGNKFLGSSANHETITEGADGDFAFNTVTNTLYSKNGNSWDRVAVLFEAADGSIIVNDVEGTLAVGTLSSQHLSGAVDITGNSIELIDGKISLSGTQIKTNRITPNSTSHLYLPQNLNINAVDYQFPTGGLGGANSYLQVDTAGNLKWAAPQSNATVFFNSSAGTVPVGGMVESAALTAMPTGWLLADGQTVAGADYPDLSAVIGDTYGANAGHTTFNLPDESANGFVFIKALPDNTATPTFKVENGLKATVDGTPVAEGDSFSPLADEVIIAAPVPGFVAYDTAGAGSFTTQATYTKFWVTGSGSTGGSRAGGAAATVYGILSAPIGTTIDYFVGDGVTTSMTPGNDSYISYLSSGLTVELARSFGASMPDYWTWIETLTANGGSSDPTDDHILAVHMLSGAFGGQDTNDGGDEEVNGNASFWGGAGAPGASNHAHGGSFGHTAPGMVKFEWGM